MAGTSIADHHITLRDERQEKGFTVITQVINKATVEGPPARTGSIVDLDIIYDKITTAAGKLPEGLINIFVEANQIADDAFFSLLAPDFIKQFEPEY